MQAHIYAIKLRGAAHGLWCKQFTQMHSKCVILTASKDTLVWRSFVGQSQDYEINLY